MTERPIRELTPDERLLVESSRDTAAPQRRLRALVLSGAALALVLIVTSPLVQSWEFLLFFAVAYIALSTWERVRCARSIVAYRRLVRKLWESRHGGG